MSHKKKRRSSYLKANWTKKKTMMIQKMNRNKTRSRNLMKKMKQKTI